MIFDTGTDKIIMPIEDLELLKSKLSTFAPIDIENNTIVCLCTDDEFD